MEDTNDSTLRNRFVGSLGGNREAKSIVDATDAASYSHAPLRSSILRPHMLHRKTIMTGCWWTIQTTRLSEIGSLVASAGIAKRNQL